MSQYITVPSISIIDKKEFIFYSKILKCFIPKFILRSLARWQETKRKTPPVPPSQAQTQAPPPAQAPPKDISHGDITMEDVDDDGLILDDDSFSVRKRRKSR